MSAQGPVPVPPSASVITLPADHYAHVGAPTEWWWHTGTLFAGDRRFGFEINAANFTLIAFTQIMLTDVDGQQHYQNTAMQTAGNWAESDPANDWFVRLGDPASSADWIAMAAPQADPTQNMSILAGFVDSTSGTAIAFDLNMSQDGPPLIVWGTGVNPSPARPGGVTENNYYYSLTRLACSGTIAIGDEKIAVDGVTWMDHEYGLFGSSAHPVKWFLQDMQLDNGVHISHYVSFPDAGPAIGKTVPSLATIQMPDGTIYFQHDCTVTPVGETWTAPDGSVFYLQFDIAIPAFEATFTVTSLVAAQDFPASIGDVYEGVAGVTGIFAGDTVSGTAWNEQRP